MFVSVLRVEDVPNTQTMDAFGAILTRVHVYFPVKHDKDFGPVIDVPYVRLIGPMETYGDVVDPLDIQRRPCFGAGERIWNDGSHSLIESARANCSPALIPK